MPAERPKPAAKPAAKRATSKQPGHAMPKADAGMAARLEAAMDGLPVYRRSMFGTVAWFVEGNAQMFAGVWGADINVRIGEEAAQREIAAGRASPFAPMPTRPMREYVLVPAAALQPAQLKRWIARGLEFTSALAAKKGK